MRAKIECILAILILAGLVVVNQRLSRHVATAEIEDKTAVIIIDSGHGGMDSGKVAVNNALEKDINLEIAKKVKEFLESQGVEVVMTREKDEMLTDGAAQNKKMQDMKKRVDLINHTMPFLTVSIHQNSYTDPDIWGAQVFYHSESEEGKIAAEIMQKSLLVLNTDNHRQAKGNADYYLLNHTETAVIIVECGFLSNPKEAELLVTEEYQQQVAEAIGKGIVAYLERK